VYNSPTNSPEFKDAIISRLSPGEHLVSYADCYEAMFWFPDDGGPSRPVAGTWFFLALTNINVRLGTWGIRRYPKPPGFFKKTPLPTLEPLVDSMNTFGLDDIVSIKESTTSNVDRGIWLRMGFDSPVGRDLYRSIDSRGKCIILTLSFTNRDGLEVISPFAEFEQVVKSIDAAKSGALVLKNTSSAVDALEQLTPLLNDGILTQEEFDRAKAGFLGSTVEVRENSLGLLRQLHSLHKSGVLSESEYNLKKWNILAEKD
jgi:hypothetical protein